ncbi:MAG: Gfo/Idh/MocA family oxidoreductase [Desulfitobacterium hafniense]|nr:Gfo/Idh/MocA family oxidoreductase [Desulfitobacterium hafniense]
MSDKVKYGIIGTGPRGQALMKAALDSGEIEIVAMSDVQSDMLEKAAQLVPQTQRFSDYHDLLALEEVDAVVVATPNHTHYGILLDCIAAGKHILSEKPVATSLNELDKIIELVKKSNIIFQVGTELRYDPMFRQMKSLVDDGTTGPVRMMWCKEFRPPFKPGYENWRLRNISGGTFLEKNIHHFDLFNWIIGSNPVKVSAFGGNEVIYKEQEVIDNGWAIVEYENGARASLGVCMFRHFGFDLQMGVMGELGTLEGHVPDLYLELKTARMQATYKFDNYFAKGFEHGGEVEQHLSFVESIRTGKPTSAGIEAARWSHLIALAAEKSVKTGQTINLREM